MALINRKHKKVPNFNYEKVKRLYFANIYQCFNQLEPFPRETYNKIVKMLQEREKILLEGNCSQTDYYTVYNKYELLTENGCVRLIKKRKFPHDPILRYVCDEDSFQELCIIHHKYGHSVRERNEMIVYVRKNYEININLVNLLFECCNVCDYEKIEEPLPIHARGNVVWLDVLDMQRMPDGVFEYLLLYVNKQTSFILLRPLIRKCPIELSMEILKIFLDFGPPSRFEVFPCDLELFTQAMYHLTTICDSFAIPEVNCNLQPGVNSSMSIYVLRHLQSWISETGSSNWGLCCHILQWKLNNSNIEDQSLDVKTPFALVFGNASQASSSTKKDDKASVNQLEEITVETEKVLEVSDESENEPVLETFSIDFENNEVDPLEIREESTEQLPMLNTLNFVEKIPETTKTEASTSSTVTKSTPKADEKKDRPICHVCQCKILKIYRCLQCKKPVHVFCSVRNQSASSSPTFTCTSCCIRKEFEV